MPLDRLRHTAVRSFGGLPSHFWWLWTSTLVNRLGGFVSTFLAMYLTVEQGYSASFAGLVGALYGLGAALASVAAGVLTDRLGRRPTMLVAQLATAASTSALAFAEHPFAIAAVAFAVGVASSSSRPAVLAMMADIVPPQDRVRAFALNYWATNLGFALASVAAGLLAQFGYQLLFFGEAAMVLVCAVIVFRRLPETRPSEPEPAPEADGKPAAKVSLGTVLRDGRFMTVAGLNLVLASLIQQAFVALPVTMGQQGFSSADFGAVIALNGVLIVLLQIPVTRFIEHRHPGRLLVASSLLVGYGFGMHAFADSLAMYAVAIAVWTLGEIIDSPTLMGLVARLSPLHGRGRYQGMFALSWSASALGGPLLSGLVIDTYGAGTLWTSSAVLGTAVAVGYGFLLRRAPGTTGTDGTDGSDGCAAPVNGPEAAPRTHPAA